ncbi:unnamed protein product [Rotaria sp. Silwood2]|nr:unnamed protein product [Rotaria sp. Silwood2]CAF4744617.1 unnamed protein product [Rotaria sp. Silwood2]
MYRFSRGRTKPQAILMLCSLLMFIVVAINVFVYLLIPQYAIYGDQYYSSISNVCQYYLFYLNKITKLKKPNELNMSEIDNEKIGL